MGNNLWPRRWRSMKFTTLIKHHQGVRAFLSIFEVYLVNELGGQAHQSIEYLLCPVGGGVTVTKY